MMKKDSLKKFIYLSIAAAIVTIVLKFAAYRLTGSVGFFSDALESLVNLIAAVMALVLLHISEKPANKRYMFGYGKAEYFSSIIEGMLIMVAAFSILYSAIPRLIHPQAIENVNIGMLLSLAASLVNFAVAQILIKNGKRRKSMLLEADGKHLLTDVWTSVGVIAAVFLVKMTGWLLLDPIIAIGVAIHIIYIGYGLILRSASGLLDTAIESVELKKITTYLNSLKNQEIEYHSLMTREAGQRRFISFHLLVPGRWTVKKGHDYADMIERHIEDMFDAPVTVSTHLEPIEDPASFDDIGLNRKKETSR